MSDLPGPSGPLEHCWSRLFTPNVGSASAKERMTFYYCVKCKHLFTHFYHLYPKLSEAMESERVPTECMPDTITLDVPSQDSDGKKEADKIADQLQQTGEITFLYKKMFLDEGKQEILEVVKVGDEPAVKLTTDFQLVLDQACIQRGLRLVQLTAPKEVLKKESTTEEKSTPKPEG